jgi:pimeloyl-ACP methyl ester carboxylesterase
MTVSTALVMRKRSSGIEFLRRPGRRDATGLLLLHGIGSRAQSFSAIVCELPRSIDAVAWNAPGYSESDALPTLMPSPSEYALALLRLLDDLGFSRVIVAGHSLGALFAASFASHNPDRVISLALLSPALGYRVAPGVRLPSHLQARITDLDTQGPTAFAYARADRLVYEATQNPHVVSDVRAAMAAVRREGYSQAVYALAQGDLLADASTVSAPTLVAVGVNDTITPPDNARRLYEAVPNPAGFHEVPASGHALPQEHPRLVANLLVELAERYAEG